ncbi:hypothetical protein R6Q59_022880 [Mikania micrantha]
MEAGASSHGGMEGNRNDRDQRCGERESRGDSKSGALCGSALVLIQFDRLVWLFSLELSVPSLDKMRRIFNAIFSERPRIFIPLRAPKMVEPALRAVIHHRPPVTPSSCSALGDSSVSIDSSSCLYGFAN